MGIPHVEAAGCFQIRKERQSNSGRASMMPGISRILEIVCRTQVMPHAGRSQICAGVTTMQALPDFPAVMPRPSPAPPLGDMQVG
jgi:hypothetical protein